MSISKTMKIFVAGCLMLVACIAWGQVKQPYQPSPAREGMIWYNTVNQQTKIYQGHAWRMIFFEGDAYSGLMLPDQIYPYNIDSTEFGYLNGVTSSIQENLDNVWDSSAVIKIKLDSKQDTISAVTWDDTLNLIATQADIAGLGGGGLAWTDTINTLMTVTDSIPLHNQIALKIDSTRAHTLFDPKIDSVRAHTLIDSLALKKVNLVDSTGGGYATQYDISEAVLEGFLDLQDLQGAVTDAQVPDNITITETGDISAVTAGAGLTGGATTGAATVNLDTANVRQITGAWTFTGDFALPLHDGGTADAVREVDWDDGKAALYGFGGARGQLAAIEKQITIPIDNPKHLTADTTMIWANRMGSTFTIDSVWAETRGNLDDFDFSLIEVPTDAVGTSTLIEALVIGTETGTSYRTGKSTAIDHAAIQNGMGISYMRSADSTNVVIVVIYGRFTD